jgi:hypothetical protein
MINYAGPCRIATGSTIRVEAPTTVRYRELGLSGPAVSGVGYGTWGYGEGR